MNMSYIGGGGEGVGWFCRGKMDTLSKIHSYKVPCLKKEGSSFLFLFLVLRKRGLIFYSCSMFSNEVVFFILIPCFKKRSSILFLLHVSKRGRLFLFLVRNRGLLFLSYFFAKRLSFYSFSMFWKEVFFLFYSCSMFTKEILFFYSLSMFAKEDVFFILIPCFHLFYSCSMFQKEVAYICFLFWTEVFFFLSYAMFAKEVIFFYSFYMFWKKVFFFILVLCSKKESFLSCFMSDTISCIVHGRAKGPGRVSPLPAHLSRKSGSNLRPTQEQLWIKLYPPYTVYSVFFNSWWKRSMRFCASCFFRQTSSKPPLF